MTANVTIARPYANAAFEYALSQKQLQSCSAILADLAFAINADEVKAFLMNPSSTLEQQIELLTTLSKKHQAKDNFPVDNFIRLLAENKRLLVLPEIHQLFEEMKAEHEKLQTVHVFSFSPLTKEQQERLKQSLSNRLKREISIDVTIDPSLIGGAVIHAGDLVINGSVRDKLLKLSADLVA